MATKTDPELAKDGLAITASTGSSHDGTTPVPREGETEHLPDFEHEKALTWKFDLRILPMLAVMYLFNALDKVCSQTSNCKIRLQLLSGKSWKCENRRHGQGFGIRGQPV